MSSIHISEISTLAIHKVGNQADNEGISFSRDIVELTSETSALLYSYFIKPFKFDEYFTLHHEVDINLNEVFTYAKNIFDSPESLFDQSINLAKHLYASSAHPKIKSGELFVGYFKNCNFEGDTIDAIGIFKSEAKDTFLKLRAAGGIYNFESETGINIDNLDKGCLIFNKNRDDGFVVSVADTTARGSDAVFWIDGFLHLARRNDDYNNTKNVLSLYRSFVTKELPSIEGFSKSDQAELLNRSMDFFKRNDSFDMESFTNDVVENPDLIQKFHSFRSDYQVKSDTVISDSFSISEKARIKQARIYKSVVKLDRNFDIYIHGSKDLIEKGVDEKGRKYYKIFYTEEH